MKLLILYAQGYLIISIHKDIFKTILRFVDHDNVVTSKYTTPTAEQDFRFIN